MALGLILYAAVAVFVVAVIVRAIKIISLPLHLRWELYPVAHERHYDYGGSFLEKLDWWKHEPESRPLGALRVMVPEIVLLQGVHEHNRSLWWRSFPFHFGLYVTAGFIVLLVAGAIAQAAGTAVGPAAGGLGVALHWLTVVCGLGGFGLVALGSLLLLLRRLGDPVLRTYSSAADFFNLLAFLAGSGIGIAAYATVDGEFAMLRGFVQAAITFNFTGGGWPPALVTAEILIGAFLVAYIPLTHMSHFFTKYFMWHDVRWGDAINRPGSAIEKRVQAQLGQKVSWAAPHIQGGGTKTWVDVATEEVAKK